MMQRRISRRGLPWGGRRGGEGLGLGGGGVGGPGGGVRGVVGLPGPPGVGGGGGGWVRGGWGFALGGAAGDVGLGLGVVLHADHGDRVERVVGLPVTAAVEAVAGDLAAGGFDR